MTGDRRQLMSDVRWMMYDVGCVLKATIIHLISYIYELILLLVLHNLHIGY